MPTNLYQKLLSYSFRLLGRKAYSEAEIMKRLNRRAQKLKLGDQDEVIQRVIARLRELNYLNDKKILEDFFEYRLKARPIGKYLFLHQMHRRGISLEAASQEWEKRKIEERELAGVLVKKRLQDLLRRDPKAPQVLLKKRLAQFLASRGFSAETTHEQSECAL